MLRPSGLKLFCILAMGAALGRGHAAEDLRDCEQYVLPGILRDVTPAAPEPAADLVRALANGLQLAASRNSSLVAALRAALPEGFAVHGGSTAEITHALRAGGAFRGGPLPTRVREQLEAEAPYAGPVEFTGLNLVTDGELEGGASLLEVSREHARVDAVGMHVLASLGMQGGQFAALLPVIAALADKSNSYYSLEQAAGHYHRDGQRRRALEDLLRLAGEPAGQSLRQAEKRKGWLVVFGRRAIPAGVVLEDPEDPGSILLVHEKHPPTLRDVYALIPLSSFDYADLVAVEPSLGTWLFRRAVRAVWKF